jgi:hypothetical protein
VIIAGGIAGNAIGQTPGACSVILSAPSRLEAMIAARRPSPIVLYPGGTNEIP